MRSLDVAEHTKFEETDNDQLQLHLSPSVLHAELDPVTDA